MGILEFFKKPADDAELKKDDAIRAGIDAELGGHPAEATEQYKAGGREDLQNRIQSPESVAGLAADQKEKYPPAPQQ